MNQPTTLGWDHPADDCVIHALTVALALRELGREVTPEAVVEALSTAEPGKFVTDMLSSRMEDWAEELLELVERASDLASRLSELEASKA